MHTKTSSIKRTFSAVAIVLGCSFPLASVAETLIQAKDTIAGMGAEIRFTGFTPSTDLDCTVETPAGDELLIPVRTDTEGNATAELRPRETEHAGVYSILVQGAAMESFEALPELLDPFGSSLEAAKRSITPDGRDSVEMHVHLQDRYGNALSGRPVALIGSRAEDRITPLSRETNAQGNQEFVVTTTMPGTAAFRAMDLLSGTMLSHAAELSAGGSAAVGSVSVAMPAASPVLQSPLVANLTQNRFYYFSGQVTSYDVIDHFRITAPATAQLGVEIANLSLEAVDRIDRRVLDYVGTVIFSTTDPLATLPLGGEYTFKQVNQGLKDFPVVFKFETPGPQTIRVEDKANRTVLGEATIVVSGLDPSGNAGKKIVITSHKNRQGVNTNTIVLEGDAPPFINLIVQGGLIDATGESDQDGHFRIPVQLNPEQKDTTIRIRDEANRYDSGPLVLVYDPDPPRISAIIFSPEFPETQMETMVAVQTEPKLPKVTLTINDPVTGAAQEFTLSENITLPGTYQAFFTPITAGSYQPTISATDSAGNTDVLRTTLKVQPRGLSRVEGLTAVPIMSEVELRWNPVLEDVDGYRIYIGEDPSNFPYTLDTGRPITLTRVRGLVPGKQYAFALTALKDDAESKEKSDVITVRILGLTLDVTPQPNALLVRWSNFGKDLPLQSFILEYGRAPDKLTEKRLLHGDLRAYTLRDLLGGVRYHLKLTPVTTTGDLLTDLAATGEGTPLNGPGELTLGPGDPLSGDGTIANFPPEVIDGSAIPSTTLPPLDQWNNGGQLSLDAFPPTSGTPGSGVGGDGTLPEGDEDGPPPFWQWPDGGGFPPGYTGGSSGVPGSGMPGGGGTEGTSLPPFGSGEGYGNGMNPPPSPVDELHSGAPLEPVGIPPIAWWLASATTIPGFSMFLTMRRKHIRTRAFQKMVEAQYHG